MSLLSNNLGSGGGYSPAAMTNANLAAFTMGDGLTVNEYLIMASDWQTFQTALGRQV